MPTPSQPRVIIETPYGTGELRDARHYKDSPNHPSNRELAHFYFPKLTINRKDYEGVRFSLKPSWGYDDAEPFRTHDDNYHAGLTDSARAKVSEALKAHADKYAPYFEELDDASKRAQLKADMTYEIKQGLYKVAPNRHHRGEDFESKNALIDEILGDLMARRAAGADWGTIYFDDDIKGK